MNWTPDTLARAFHEAYSRAAARAYGGRREPEPWEALSEQAQSLMLEACADLLGADIKPRAMAAAVPVPSREEFAEAAETAPGDGPEEEGDWRAEIERQIEGVTASRIRRVAKTVREPFRK